MFKPRFGRSSPSPVKASGIRNNNSGRMTQTQANEWKPVSMETLGYLAATAKIGILQVHQRVGDRFNLKFAKAFLDNVDLQEPTKKDMDQIQLYSHLLFA